MKTKIALLAFSLFLSLAAPRSVFADQATDDFRHHVKPGQAALLIDGELVAVVNLVRFDDKHIKFDIKGPVSKLLQDWLVDSFNKKHTRKSGEIVASEFNYEAMHSREFTEALISKLTFPTIDVDPQSPTHLSVTFVPKKHRKKPRYNVKIDFSVMANWNTPNFVLLPGGIGNCQ